jgi:ribonuclease D
VAEDRAAFEPRGGVPGLLITATGVADYASAVAAGSGPIAVDAERASGFRYSQRAYLVQVRREGAGTALIDPIEVPDLSGLHEAAGDAEWIIHAATQDLPCLAEVGIRPRRIFDTELAGRLLGRERVSLAALVESELGEVLEKGHGAADWSVRPLTADQLRYAALDVELLIELRDLLHAALVDSGKHDYAEQEFAALVDFTPRERGEEPWRRTSGIHRLRKPRQFAVVRALWEARDAYASSRDIAPGRVLPDAAIIAAAQAMPTSRDAMIALKEFSGRGQQRQASRWWQAISSAQGLADEALPLVNPPSTGLPQPRSWPDRNPEAAKRLERARAHIAAVSAQVSIPVENLMTPELVRRICWEPPAGPLVQALADAGARPWQIAVLGPGLEAALAEPA